MTRVGPPIGTGATAEVVAYGADILKLYLPGVSRDAADREAAILDTLADLGIAAPRSRGVVAHEGRWGVVMSRARGRPFAEAMLADPSSVPAHIDALVDLHRVLHRRAATGLRSHQARLADHIRRADRLPRSERERLLLGLERMPNGDRVCHGDFHPFNVLGTPACAEIIDWVDATSGPPLADLARTWILLHAVAPEMAESYVTRYLAASGAPRAAMEAWLPLVAAGRLAEKATDAEAADLIEIAARSG